MSRLLRGRGSSSRRRSSALLSDNFSSYTTNAQWAEGGTLGLWRNQFLGTSGYAKIVDNGGGDKAVELKATAPAGQTTAALLTSVSSVGGQLRITGRMRTLAQTGSVPNDWECAWLFWNYNDIPGAGDQGTGNPTTVVRKCYYLSLKPQAAQGTGGWEIGKLDQSLFPGGQRFLASAGSANYPVGTAWRYFEVTCVPATAPDNSSPGVKITARAGNSATSLTTLGTFTDGPGSGGSPTWASYPTQTIYTSGQVGLYQEDAQVQFDDIVATNPSYRRGVNLAGPEYGCGNSVETNTGSGAFSYSSIGTYGTAFIYPLAADLTYMATQLGPSPIFRFNVRIERLMTGPGSGFRTAEQTRVQALLDNAQSAGAGVIMAPWNFGAVWNPTRQAIGSAGFSVSQFADFWSRVVTQWGSHPAFLAADLMTEPVGVTGGAAGWQTAAQAAVDAIRAVNTSLWIWVPTYDYQIHTVATSHPNGPWINDTTGNFGYTQHQYAYSMGGSEYDYTNTLNTAIADGWTASGNTDALHTRELSGINTYKNWVGAHPVYIGEYGCPNPQNSLVSGTDAPKWLALWDRLLTEYDANGWWATAWTSGSAVDITDPNELYCTYYASGGWQTTVNSKTGTASQTEAHPSFV